MLKSKLMRENFAVLDPYSEINQLLTKPNLSKSEWQKLIRLGFSKGFEENFLRFLRQSGGVIREANYVSPGEKITVRAK